MRKRVIAWLLPAILLAVLLFTFGAVAYPFLAVPNRYADAGVLVVEGWIDDHALAEAAAQFQRDGYQWAAVSDFQSPGRTPPPREPICRLVAKQLNEIGVPAHKTVACPAPAANWNRTSTSARAVRDQLAARGIHFTSVNVVTIGPHGRQTRLAYQRMLGPGVRVGIIPVPHVAFSPSRWWASPTGWKWMSKGFAGWLKEWLFGYRRQAGSGRRKAAGQSQVVSPKSKVIADATRSQYPGLSPFRPSTQHHRSGRKGRPTVAIPVAISE